MLLALCLLVLLLVNSYEITFLIWSLTALISIGFRYSVRIVKLLLVLTAILLVSFFSSFFNEYHNFNFFRDIAYLLKPIIGLVIGYNITKKLGKEMVYVVIKLGALIALIHILILIVCYTLFSIHDMNDIRKYGGYFNDFEVYILILLLFKKQLNLVISRQKTILFIVLISISTFLYFARTNLIQLVILTLAMKGYLKLTPKSIKILTTVGLFTIASYSMIYYSYPQRNGKGLEGFFYKVKNAPIEAFKTKINEDDWKEFNDNYRSFENIKTVKQVTASGWFTIIFGKGLGSTVDVGREMWTNDGEQIRFEPTLHNAYMTMLLKSGLIGVFLLVLFIYFLLKQGKTDIASVKNINYLLIGSAVYLILSNWVFMGIYLKLDNKSIFLGFLLCYKELLLKEHSQLVKHDE